MNIFFLDPSPKLSAQWLCDKHIVKMQLESAQMLSTAHRILDGTQQQALSKTGRKVKRWILPDIRDTVLYTATHINHPSTIWTRSSKNHYNWHVQLLKEMHMEYTRRYGKTHKTESMISYLELLPKNLTQEGWQDPPPAMPDEYKVKGNSVLSYINYYRGAKARLAFWRYSSPPPWW